ncbi:zeta toxin family protein [Streptomyces antibioticus]|uniref:zeta toxin family protein n=1 Tax=Streptomyces antibioticus TaxID=1890 RepID=UPI0033D4EF4E
MIDPAEVARYRLPQETNERIFREWIVPDLLEGRTPTPIVIFLVGQPGAGKSKVTELLAEKLNQHGGSVDIDSDLYKPYHEKYPELVGRDDTLMAAYTRADGRAWMKQAEDYVRVHKLHTIIQETSQDAVAVRDKMLAYRESGARVEASSPPRSTASCTPSRSRPPRGSSPNGSPPSPQVSVASSRR